MARSQSLHIYILANLLFAFSFKAISTSKHRYHGLKTFHFALYQHETINKTTYVTVNGVAGTGFSQTTSPFGTLAASQDPLRLTSNPSSKVVGFSEGGSVTTSFDGFTNIGFQKITLQLKKYKGSISHVGTTHNTKPTDVPVKGGTGDFMFVQGFLTPSPVFLNGTILVYKIEFHLYWPPPFVM